MVPGLCSGHGDIGVYEAMATIGWYVMVSGMKG